MIDNSTSYGGISSGSVFGALASVVDSTITNAVNYDIADKNMKLTKATNAQNEALMRESWLRDDTAVQRRVADLKAAGISPLLAAGSAAGNSGAIQFQAPQNNYQMKQLGLLSALSAAQQIKGMALDNQLKALNIRYYGMPDWLIGIQRVIGELPHDSVLRSTLEKALDWFGSKFGGSDDGGSDDEGVHYTFDNIRPSEDKGYLPNESPLDDSQIVTFSRINKAKSLGDNLTLIMNQINDQGARNDHSVLKSVIFELMDAYGMDYNTAASYVYYYRNEIDRPDHHR